MHKACRMRLPSPIPTISPSKYVYASNTVQYQYPPAGTMLYENQTVDLFFYDIRVNKKGDNNKLLTVRQYRELSVPLPIGIGNRSQVNFRITARPNDTGKPETIYDPQVPIYTSLFPLTAEAE